MRKSYGQKDRSLPLFIDSVGNHWDQEAVDRPQGYKYAHWMHSQKGKGEIKVGGKTYTLHEGRGFLMAPGVPHSYRSLDPEWQTCYVTFGGSLVQEILRALKISECLFIQEENEFIIPYAEKLVDMVEKNPDMPAYHVSGHLYMLLMYIKEYLENNRVYKSDLEDIIWPVAKYLEENYASPISNEDLSNLVNYSIQYTTRLFKKVYHISPYQYLLETRIRKAKEQLVRDPDVSIQQVSEDCGFNDVSYFITAFRKSEKMTPRAFKLLYHPKEN